MESLISIKNPNPCLLKNGASSSSMALCYSPTSSLGFAVLRLPRNGSRKIVSFSPRGPHHGLLPLLSRKHSVSSSAASHEESKPSDMEIEKEKNELKAGAEESEEAWKQLLESFKEQALKMQAVSQEAYELYSQKAIVVLKETSEKLKIQADKARQDLSVIAKEISEESKGYLSTAAENSPEEVKDIVETFASASSTDELKDVSRIRDFYIGIPYGTLLSVGGFLSFMVTGSIPAIRFGVILGGALLALSVSSLRSWRRGESSAILLKGQAAIATVLFLRDLRILFMRPFVSNLITAFISGAVTAFYAYRIMNSGGQTNQSNLEMGPEN